MKLSANDQVAAALQVLPGQGHAIGNGFVMEAGPDALGKSYGA